jgi:hypothetical protein
MFADPQTVTVNAVAKVMPRIEVKGTSATYQLADKTFTLNLGHTVSKGRVRSLARIDQRAIVADPLTAVNDYETLSFYVVIDRPEAGFSMVQTEQLIAGLKTWLDNAAIDKLFGIES